MTECGADLGAMRRGGPRATCHNPVPCDEHPCYPDHPHGRPEEWRDDGKCIFKSCPRWRDANSFIAAHRGLNERKLEQAMIRAGICPVHVQRVLPDGRCPWVPGGHGVKDEMQKLLEAAAELAARAGETSLAWVERAAHRYETDAVFHHRAELAVRIAEEDLRRRHHPGHRTVRTFHEYIQHYTPDRWKRLRERADVLHAEHHDGSVVPTLDSCKRHTVGHYVDLVLALEETGLVPRT